MPIPLLIAAGVMAAGGVAKSIIGASQAAKARRMAEQNVRPQFEISPEYFENQALAQSMAMSGLPQSSLNYYTSNLERGLTNTTDAALQAGGGPNAIAASYDVYRQGLGQIAAQDAEMRNANIRYLIDRNRDIAEQRTMQWSIDKYEPYKDTARAATALQKQGTENIFSGISQVGSAVAAYGTGQLYTAGQPGGVSTEGQAAMATGGGSGSPSPVAGSFSSGTFGAGTEASIPGGPSENIRQVMQGMENSPYRDYIQEQLQRDYGIYNPSTVA